MGYCWSSLQREKKRQFTKESEKAPLESSCGQVGCIILTPILALDPLVCPILPANRYVWLRREVALNAQEVAGRSHK